MITLGRFIKMLNQCGIRTGANSGSYAMTGTWAELVAALPFAEGTRLRCSNIGRYGSDLIANSAGRLLPLNGSVCLNVTDLPIVKAPTINANASGTANGATTLATSLTIDVLKGFFYCPANSIVASHAAGFYYGEMSSATAITFYNNTYTPAAGVYPTEPTSKVAFAGAVPGGTGITAEVTALITGISGGFIGKHGSVVHDLAIECNNNANAKVVRIRPNSGNAIVAASIASCLGIHAPVPFRNYGSESLQRATAGFACVNVSSNPVRTFVDTSADWTVAITLETTAAGTDFIILSMCDVFARVQV